MLCLCLVLVSVSVSVSVSGSPPPARGDRNRDEKRSVSIRLGSLKPVQVAAAYHPLIVGVVAKAWVPRARAGCHRPTDYDSDYEFHEVRTKGKKIDRSPILSISEQCSPNKSALLYAFWYKL